MTRAGILEITGIVEQRAADRERWGRFAYRAPVILSDPPKLVAVEPEPKPVDLVAEEAPPSAEPEQPPVEAVSTAILVPVANDERPRRFKPDPRYPERTICAVVCMAFGVTEDELFSKRRVRRLAYARFAACRLLRDRRNLSYPKIGRWLKIDHSSAIHGYQKAAKLLEHDPEWADIYRAAEQRLLAQ